MINSTNVIEDLAAEFEFEGSRAKSYCFFDIAKDALDIANRIRSGKTVEGLNTRDAFNDLRTIRDDINRYRYHQYINGWRISSDGKSLPYLP